MTVQEIEQLISFIERLQLAEVQLETADIKLHIKRSNIACPPIPVAPSIAGGEQPTTVAPFLIPSTQPLSTAQQTTADSHITIKSPMIGTFYRSPGPNKPPFVEEGTSVQIGQALCVIEAMKLFNEIESEIAGTLVKILVDDASPVEYDQPLFLIKPL